MTTGGVSSASIASAAGIEALIKQYMALERQSITKITAKKDELDVRKAVYSDIDTKLNAVRDALEALYDQGNTSGSVFNNLSVSSSDEAVLSASTTNSAVSSSYNVTVNSLAQRHRISSSRQSSTTGGLGLSGSFYVGGARNRAVSRQNAVAGTVEGFGIGGVREDEKELGSGKYYVEVRKEGTWQFRLVNENGEAVKIAKAGGTRDTMTSGWQDLSDVAGTTYQTGRGLSIDFSNVGSYTSGTYTSGAASVDYTAKGTKISVTSSSSLTSIANAINNGTYADGNQVTASVVNKTLVISSASTGTNSYIELDEVSGGVLSSLGLLSRAATDATNLVDDEGVTKFGTGNLATFTAGEITGASELTAGQYYVEIGSGTNAGKFRLVDNNGNAVAIAGTSGGTTSTSDWIAIHDGEYDTGRGLTITFQGNGDYDPATRTTGAARVNYDRVNAIQGPIDAEFEVDGLTVVRGSNDGLSDVIDGVTLSLKTAGSSTVSVAPDYKQVTEKIKAFLDAYNDLLKYIQKKTESTKSTDSEGNATYTAGTLSTDWGLKSLRRSLATDLLAEYTDAKDGAVSHLYELGIELDDGANGLSFSITNSSTLSQALKGDFEGVQSFFAYILDRVGDRISPYLDGDYAIIETTQANIDQQIKRVETQIESAEALLKTKEQALRTQYQAWSSQLTNWTNEYTLIKAYQSVASNINTTT